MKMKGARAEPRNCETNHAPHESTCDQRLAPAPSPKLCEVCPHQTPSRPAVGGLPRLAFARKPIATASLGPKRKFASASKEDEARGRCPDEVLRHLQDDKTHIEISSLARAKGGRRRDCKVCVEAGAQPQLASIPPTLEHEGTTQ